jgi:cbb3-type cytochrome oxidase subunit 1
VRELTSKINTPIFSPRLAKLTAILWNAAITIGILLILSGNTQGREYAELPWSIDVLVMIVLMLILLDIFLILAKRNKRKLYVSTWYYLGTFLWFPIVYFTGNVIWKPPTGALFGDTDAIFNW